MWDVTTPLSPKRCTNYSHDQSCTVTHGACAGEEQIPEGPTKDRDLSWTGATLAKLPRGRAAPPVRGARGRGWGACGVRTARCPRAAGQQGEGARPWLGGVQGEGRGRAPGPQGSAGHTGVTTGGQQPPRGKGQAPSHALLEGGKGSGAYQPHGQTRGQAPVSRTPCP